LELGETVVRGEQNIDRGLFRLSRLSRLPRLAVEPAVEPAAGCAVGAEQRRPQMDRNEVVALILETRKAEGLKWSDLAAKLGKSKEWVTAGCLGQMTFSAEQAALLVEVLSLPVEASSVLQTPPYRGSLPTAVPTDPLIYRFHELVSVYGTTFKELIQEEFGDGIMSAIDFRMDIQREPDPAGDRVQIVMSGKFLPYKAY
jgi:cyanate lyase